MFVSMLDRLPRPRISWLLVSVVLIAVVVVVGSHVLAPESESEEPMESLVVGHGWNDGPWSVDVRVGTINEMGTGELFSPAGSQDHAEWFLESGESSAEESQLVCDKTTMFLYAAYEGPDQREEIVNLMDPDCEGGYVVHIDSDGRIHLFEMA